MIVTNEIIHTFHSGDGILEFSIRCRALHKTVGGPVVRRTYMVEMLIDGYDVEQFSSPDLSDTYVWALNQIETPRSYHILKYG